MLLSKKLEHEHVEERKKLVLIEEEKRKKLLEWRGQHKKLAEVPRRRLKSEKRKV